MIIIAGQSADWEESGMSEVQKRIYLRKKQSSKVYEYSSPDVFSFELKLRENLVEAARALNQSGVAFTTFRNSRCNERYWIRTAEGGFRLKEDAEPSAAIRDIFVNGKQYAFECATAIVIVLYKGVLETIGEGPFNRLFGKLYLWDWNYDSDLQLVDEGKKDESFPGDVQYFQNPDVSPKTTWWQGENVIKLDDDLYYGHGVGIRPAQGMIDKLNSHRKPDSKTSAYLTEHAVHPDFAYLVQTAGYGGTSAAAPIREGYGTRLSVRVGHRIYVMG